MKKFLLLTLFVFSSILTFANEPIFEEVNEEEKQSSISPYCNISSWGLYKINFGMEKIYVRFPYRPFLIQENGLFIASTTYHQVLYKFIGYFPPIGNIDPFAFINRELDAVSVPPFLILGHTTYQTTSGAWVLDYTVHDTFANMIIKHRSVITPFNAYSQRAIFPNGLMDEFDFFLDSFRIQVQ